MKNIKKIMLFLSLTIASYSFAGVKVIGNGGDAVVCYADATRSIIKSVRLFDYWEQEQVLKYGPNKLGSMQLSIQEKIEIATNRISKFDPFLAGQIKQLALNLANNIQNYLVTNYSLPEIDDANPQAIPSDPNCYIEQYAVQYKDLITGQRRFSIADKFYNNTSTTNDERVGIILHEAIYRYAIGIDPALSNSDNVRYFNYVVGSDFLNTLKAEDTLQFHDILVRTHIHQSDCVSSNGVYLKTDGGYGSTESCYNQTMNLGPNIFIGLTQGSKILDYVMVPSEDNSSISYTRKGITIKQANLNLPLVVNLNFSGKTKQFLTNELSLSETNLTLSSIKENSLASNELLIKGPFGIDFICQNYLNFNKTSLELIDCSIKKTQIVVNAQTYVFGGYMKQLSRERWIITRDSGAKYKLLGSKKSLVVASFGGAPSDANTTCKNDLITVDSNLNLVAGCFKSDHPLEINGQTVSLLNNFEVQWVHDEYFLKGQVAYNHNAQGIYNPIFKNLRLVKSSENEKFNYCGTLKFPSKLTWVWGKADEYIGYPGESFYDISTDSVVYKTDENVSVVSRVGCQASDFLSNDY